MADAQSMTSLPIIGRVDEKAIATAVPEPRIQAYDLSPDGNTLAMYVVSGDQVHAPSWLVIADVKTSKILRHVEFGLSPSYIVGYAPQVAFTPDGKLLVVQDEQTVRVLESENLRNVRKIDPPAGSRFKVPARIQAASSSNTFAITFGDGKPLQNYKDGQSVHTEMIDAANGTHTGSWDSDHIPLSLSPDAKLVVVPDRLTKSVVIGVEILDTKSGKKITTLNGWEVLGTHVSLGIFGTRLLGKFVNDDELLLTSDANADKSGRDLGAILRDVRISDGKVLQEIAPVKYGPTGEMAVSADQKDWIALSRYSNPADLKHPWAIPHYPPPELMVFSGLPEFRLVARVQVSTLLGLRMYHLFENSGLRISADGSVIAIAENNGVTVMQNPKH